MAGPVRPGALARIALLAALGAAALVGSLAPSDPVAAAAVQAARNPDADPAAGVAAARPVDADPAAAASLARWTGGIDLYRSGVFTTQKTWLWCTAADIQIIRNIVDHRADHSRATQQRAFAYMRVHDRYAIPVSDGVDPGGWTAGLRHYVDSRYRLYASHSFSSALRSAVTNLRRTNRPVGITVSHGNHAWILTGFTATADPAVTTRFTVTSVRVVGPLWGLQSRSYGYDMRPDVKLTPKQFATFFTPWHYAKVHMAWEGRWVSVQAVAVSNPKAATAPHKTATPAATHKAASQATKAPAMPTPSVTAAPATGLADPVAALVSGGAAGAATTQPPPPSDDDVAGAALLPATSRVDATDDGRAVLVVVVVVAAGLAGVAGLTLRSRRAGRG